MLKSLRLAESGNVAIIFALSLVPIMILIGSTIDLRHISNTKNQMSYALDAAVISAANLQYSGDPKETALDVFTAQMQQYGIAPSDISLQVKTQSDLNARRVSATASVRLDLFMGFATGKDDIEIEVTSVAEQSIPNIEIAMVLDISSSMRGNRLTNLKSASTAFIDIMLDEDSQKTTSISVVPFGGTVNIGQDLFARFAVTWRGRDTIRDPSQKAYTIGQRVEDGAFRFSDGDYCIEHRQEDYDLDLLPTESRAQVPHFWRWWNFHPWCPGPASAVMLNTNKPEALKAHLNGMVLSDGTGMDAGALWGLKALSPEFRGYLGGDFRKRPLDFSSENTRKILIIMSDGDMTEQNRPKDTTMGNVHTNRLSNRSPNQNSKGNHGNRKNMQRVLSRGGTNDSASRDTAIGRFRRVCDTAKGEGILVFTIGFQVKTNSLADKLLSACATSGRHYYHVEGLDIASAFSSIADEVQALRIVE